MPKMAASLELLGQVLDSNILLSIRLVHNVRRDTMEGY